MEKLYKVVISGDFNDYQVPAKVDYIVISSNKDGAIKKISKRYKNIFSIRARLMLLRTIKSILKFNQ